MKIIGNVGQLATCRAAGGQGDLHVVPGAAMVWDDAGTIRWVGEECQLPSGYAGAERLDAGGRLVVPGLIDCHTHLAFAGWRADEFVQRVQGRSYLEIARSGGGILSTVRQTRAASEEALVHRCRDFLSEMLTLGITTVECKSGYGLDEESEIKLLRAYRALAFEQPIRLVPTLLAAHIVPPEYQAQRSEYVELVLERLIPRVAREQLAACCDVFVEDSAFTLDEAREILQAARRAGLSAKLHADQLTSGGGAELAAEVGAISADHLEHASSRGIEGMAAAGVVAVSLPLASLYLGQAPMSARRFIDSGVSVAVATDFNPGSAPSYHLPLAMSLACLLQRMTPAEVLKGTTLYAARAVGVEHRAGSLENGKAADFAVIDAPDVSTWLYHLRPNACRMTVIGGVVQWRIADIAPHSS
ncbi:MAG TPA: imidazolonepropionase [Gemmatimonadales bacterium]|nr:imidazolonepropionase [Gemmatimonadales bacterium]